MTFTQVVFFGYSKLFEDLSSFCAELGIRSFLITSDRLKSDCLKLFLQDVTFISANLLGDDLYEMHGILGDSAIGISIGSPFIFRDNDISFFKGNLFNSHGAPLPEYRGGGGFSWRILNGDRRGTSLIHQVELGIDSGKVLFRHSFDFDDSERLPLDFINRQLKEDKLHLLPYLKKLIRFGGQSCHDSDLGSDESYYSTYFPRLCTDIHGVIDWSQNISDIEATVCAFSHPYTGAKTYLKGCQISIFDCEIVDQRYWHPFCRGIIINSSDNGVLVACRGGTLKVVLEDIEFSDASVKPIEGDRLISSQDDLDDSMSVRAVFTPRGLKMLNFPVNKC